jgi:hypothetical protein
VQWPTRWRYDGFQRNLVRVLAGGDLDNARVPHVQAALRVRHADAVVHFRQRGFENADLVFGIAT